MVRPRFGVRVGPLDLGLAGEGGGESWTSGGLSGYDAALESSFQRRSTGAAVAWEGSSDPVDGAAEGDPQDVVPPEWILELELEAAARRAERKRRISVISAVVPAVLVAAIVITFVALSIQPTGTAVLPSAVRAFAKALPESQQPNAAGVTVVDGEDAPNTWRVAWVTQDAAFCFAFIHQREPAQTVCGTLHSIGNEQLRIAGELSDTGLDPPALFTCGYTIGAASYVEIDGGVVVGSATGMGAGLSGYCVQLPEGLAAGASFTVSTQVVVGTGYKKTHLVDVTATYP